MATEYSKKLIRDFMPVREPLPNIIIVSFDALRRDFLSIYKKQALDVPLFSRAISSGVQFQSAITSGNWTVPSHASLFTGVEPQKHGVFNWFEALPPSSPTLFSVAKQRGYRVAFLASDGVRPIVSERPNDFDIIGPAADPRAEKIQAEGEPWLIFWHFLETHAPYGIRPPRPADPNLVDLNLENPAMNYIRELVCSGRIPEIHEAIKNNLNAASAKVDELWDRLGENTIVVLLADHGEDWRRNFSFHCSFEEPVLRIPLTLSAPGISGVSNDLLVAHSDLAELIWRLAENNEEQREATIQKWLPLSQQRQRIVIAGPDGFNNQECYFATRDGEMMVIGHPKRRERQYFQLSGEGRRTLLDPAEQKAAAHLDVLLDEVISELYQDKQESVPLEEDEIVLERLKALGYF